MKTSLDVLSSTSWAWLLECTRNNIIGFFDEGYIDLFSDNKFITAYVQGILVGVTAADPEHFLEWSKEELLILVQSLTAAIKEQVEIVKNPN